MGAGRAPASRRTCIIGYARRRTDLPGVLVAGGQDGHGLAHYVEHVEEDADAQVRLAEVEPLVLDQGVTASTVPSMSASKSLQRGRWPAPPPAATASARSCLPLP